MSAYDPKRKQAVPLGCDAARGGYRPKIVRGNLRRRVLINFRNKRSVCDPNRPVSDGPGHPVFEQIKLRHLSIGSD